MRKKHLHFYKSSWLWLMAAVLLLGLGGCAGAGNASEAAGVPSVTASPTPVPTSSPVPEVSVGSRTFSAGRTRLSLSSRMGLEELTETLSRFPQLQYAAFYGGGVAPAVQEALTERFPNVTFRWDTLLLGRVVPCHTKTLSFADTPLTAADTEEIRRGAAFLPELEQVDLRGCGLSDAELMALDQALGDIDVVWSIPVYGVECLSTDTEIDISGVPVRDQAAALEAQMPMFSRLEKVVMSGCGLSNEEMDALNKKYEDVRFVWSVYFSIWSLRTDATNFICARTVNDAPLVSWQCQVLRYCPDLIALDFGHKNLTDLSFLYDLPKLQYLILVENDINDITPIGSLKELKYLEVFWTKIEDLSPLINCTKLQDLNICYIYCKPDKAFDTLMQMPWLERLWYCGNYLTAEQIDALKANMPACEMYLAPHGESTGGGWREHEHYYQMRDVFEMYYMPGGTNGVDPYGRQIIIPGCAA